MPHTTAPPASILLGKIQLTQEELADMTAAELATHVMHLSPQPVLVLGAIFDFLKDKPACRLELLRHLGLVKAAGAQSPPPPEGRDADRPVTP